MGAWPGPQPEHHQPGGDPRSQRGSGLGTVPIPWPCPVPGPISVVLVPQGSQGSRTVCVAQLPPLLLPGGHELVGLGDAVEPQFVAPGGVRRVREVLLQPQQGPPRTPRVLTSVALPGRFQDRAMSSPSAPWRSSVGDRISPSHPIPAPSSSHLLLSPSPTTPHGRPQPHLIPISSPSLLQP